MSQSAICHALEQLLVGEQRLHAALVKADGPAIFESIRTITEVIPHLDADKDASVPPEQAENARALVYRIQILQKANYALSDGALRTLRTCSELLMGGPYVPPAETLQDEAAKLNVSA